MKRSLICDQAEVSSSSRLEMARVWSETVIFENDKNERHGLSWLLLALELVPFSSTLVVFFFLILLWVGGKRCLLKWKGCNRCIVNGGVYLGLWGEIRHHLASMKKIAHQVMKRVTLKHPEKFYEHAQTYGRSHGRSRTPHRTLMLHMTSMYTLFGH